MRCGVRGEASDQVEHVHELILIGRRDRGFPVEKNEDLHVAREVLGLQLGEISHLEQLFERKLVENRENLIGAERKGNRGNAFHQSLGISFQSKKQKTGIELIENRTNTFMMYSNSIDRMLFITTL